MEINKTQAVGGGASLITILTLAIAFAEEIKGLLADMPVVGPAIEEQHHKELHDQHTSDIATLLPQVKMAADYGRKAYGNTLPRRILNLLKAKCANLQLFSQDPSREILLNNLLAEYEDLNNRAYAVGTCAPDGSYCNAMGQCNPP